MLSRRGNFFEFVQEFFRDRFVSDFSSAPPLEGVKTKYFLCENNLIPQLGLVFLTMFLVLPSQNNADQVAFQVGGGLSALEQILQVVTAASCPNAVPRIPLK